MEAMYFSFTEIMSWHSQKIAGCLLRILQLRQDQVPVIIISVKQETVVSIHPDFPGQKPDILGFDGEDFAVIVIVKSQNFCVVTTHFFPDIRICKFFIFFPVKLCQTCGVFRALMHILIVRLLLCLFFRQIYLLHLCHTFFRYSFSMLFHPGIWRKILQMFFHHRLCQHTL